LKDKVSLNKTMHSLIKENKDLSKSLNKYRDSVPKTEENLEKAHCNIRKLQAEVQVYSLAHRHSGKGGSLGTNFDEEIVNVCCLNLSFFVLFLCFLEVDQLSDFVG